MSKPVFLLIVAGGCTLHFLAASVPAQTPSPTITPTVTPSPTATISPTPSITPTPS